MPLDNPGVLQALEAWKEAKRDVAFRVRGNSMLPLVRPGDKVTLRLVDPHELKRGDLLAFSKGDNLTVHRFVKKRKDGEGWWFCQVGDNAAEWGWVPQGKVMGGVRSFQGPRGSLAMGTRPWIAVNTVLGLMLSFSITFCENLQRAKFPTLLQQGAWIQYRISKKLLRIITAAVIRILAPSRYSEKEYQY